MSKQVLNEDVLGPPASGRHAGGTPAFPGSSAPNLFVRVALALALMLPAAGCGTKTELLMPNGKPTPHDQRDPSQPPSPISR